MNNWINNKLMPPMMWFVNTRPVKAIKDGMLIALPFIMIGSVFLLLGSFPYPPILNWFTKVGLTPYWNQAYNASFGVMAIFAVVGIAYHWVKNEGFEPLPAGMTALVSFFVIMRPTTAVMNGTKTVISGSQAPTLLGGFIDRIWLGGQGMIAAILVGLLTGWIYSWFVKHHITIKLPEQVPPAVADSFVALIPAFVIVLGFLLVYIFFDLATGKTVTEWIYQTIQTPLQGMTDSPLGVLLVAFLVPFLWFFGVHGSVIVSGIISPLLIANALDNAQLNKAHEAITAANGGHIFTISLLDQFGTVTGAGMTIGLVVYMVFFARSKQLQGIGKLAIVPAFFNINEPVLFGMPIVLNPFMLLPFIFMPVFSMLLTYFMIRIGVLPFFYGTQVPWTTPPIISGLLIGGWKIMLWQILMLVVSFFVYLPFVRKQDAILFAQEQETEEKQQEAKGEA